MQPSFQSRQPVSRDLMLHKIHNSFIIFMQPLFYIVYFLSLSLTGVETGEGSLLNRNSKKHLPPPLLHPVLLAIYSVTVLKGIRHRSLTRGTHIWFTHKHLVHACIIFIPGHPLPQLYDTDLCSCPWRVFRSVLSLVGYSWSGKRQIWGLFVIGNYSR